MSRNNKHGITTIDLKRLSIEGDLTHAVIAAVIQFNIETKQTQVLLVRHTDETHGTTTRLTAGSGEEHETIAQTLDRKMKFLTGLTPTEVIYLSEATRPTSPQDPKRMNEDHTKFGCVVTEWSGELITKAPKGGETSEPFWLEHNLCFTLFKNHRPYLEDAIQYIRHNLKTKDMFTDL